MNGLRRRAVLILFTVACVRHVAVAAVAGNGPSHQAGVDFFENRIRPLLASHCLKCHGAGQDPPEAGLRLDSRPGWLAGGDSGPAIVVGDPRASRLVRAVRYDDSDLQMPPDGKLDARQIADLVRWVKIGAPDPRTAAPTHPHTQQFDLEARRQSHWAWQPIAHALPPTTGDRYWPRSAVDAFVLKQLEQAKLTPANPAVRRVLIRRVTFDLVGLPPSPEEIDTFLADDSPAAYSRLVDRLLASPYFGER